MNSRKGSSGFAWWGQLTGCRSSWPVCYLSCEQVPRVAGCQNGKKLSGICHWLLGDLKLVASLFLDLLLVPPPLPLFFIFQHGKTAAMAGDAIMVMRGLTKLSKAVLETQAGQLRQVLLGGDAVTIARTLQAAAEEQFSSALGKVQVSKALCARSRLMFCFFSRYFLVSLWECLETCIVNSNLALKCWFDNTDVAMLWEFSRISVVCSRCLDRNGMGMLLQSVCFHYWAFKTCWK